MCDRILVFDADPGHIAAEIPVSLPHPRNRLDDDFHGIVDEFYSILTSRATESIRAQRRIYGGLVQPLQPVLVNPGASAIDEEHVSLRESLGFWLVTLKQTSNAKPLELDDGIAYCPLVQLTIRATRANSCWPSSTLTLSCLGIHGEASMSTTIAIPSATPDKSSTSSVEFNVHLQAGDFYRAECTIVWRQVRLLVGLATGFVVLRTIAAGSVLLLAASGLISLVSLAIYSALMYFGARSTLRTNRVLGAPMHYTLTAGGMATTTPTFRSQHTWENLHEVIETSRLLILRLSSVQKNVIPKRCLAPGQLEGIRALAKPRVTSSAGNQEKPPIISSALLTAKVRITAEDLYWGCMTLLLRKSYWYTGQLVFSFGLIFLLHPQFISPVAFVVLGAVFFVYFAIGLYHSSARAVRTNVAYRSEIEYAFCESGLEASGPTFFFHHDWGNFQAVIETSKMFLFCPSDSQMLVIPKTALIDISNVQALRTILKSCYRGKLSLKS